MNSTCRYALDKRDPSLALQPGLAIGIVGDAGVRANAQQPRLYVGMILILIFAEALGLYGLIVGLVVASTATVRRFLHADR